MRRMVVVACAVVSMAAAACSPSSPEIPEGADPVLSEGRDVFQSNCTQCHDADGGGGRGPRLNDGAVVEAYPDIADQIAVVTGGKGDMPAFAARLTDAEIEAVVRYTREVLDDVG